MFGKRVKERPLCLECASPSESRQSSTIVATAKEVFCTAFRVPPVGA